MGRRGTMNRRRLVGLWPGIWAPGLAVLVVGTVLLTPVLRADDTTQTARAVRLSYVDGKVKVTQGGELLADPALVNTPLFEGTEVSTSEDGRAELEFDDGSVIRLSPNSSLTLTVLGGEGGSGDEVVLASGLGYFELQGQSSTSHMRVRFGDSVVTTDGFTVIRINLDNPPGEVGVFSGNAHLERSRGTTVDLHGGESVTLNAADPTQSIVAESIEPDSWDTWNSDRDQELTSLAAAQTGAANSLPDNNNPAWNDLDANGNWYNVPGQGSVWSPHDAANPGWDPYGNGYWMWTPRFGYIWVSGESWGYMPFQCGAWNFYNDFGWGWAPGGCLPWWGGGGGWSFNIGYHPGHYRPPPRPHPGRPRRIDDHPLRVGSGGFPGNAVVPVDRRQENGLINHPVRERNGIVTIGGHPVEPLRPVSPRPRFERPSMGQIYRSQPGNAGANPPAGQRPATGFVPGGNHPVYTPPARPQGGNHPVYTPPARSSGSTQPVYSPPPRAPSGNQNVAPPSRAPSGGGSPSFHPSGGGGGGGGSHSGGGGGGSHSGGGGNSSSSGHR